jgi:hypothetical protein
MAVTTTSIKLNARLVDEAATILGTKSRAETVRTALQEIVALKRFKEVDEEACGQAQVRGLEDFCLQIVCGYFVPALPKIIFSDIPYRAL